MLFENSFTGYPLTLSWSVTIEFEPLRKDVGDVSPSLTVEWVPADGGGWKGMSRRRFACGTFGEPVEASLYFFEHFRFDHAEVLTGALSGSDLGVELVVRGDLDGLGIPRVSAQAVLGFEGIYVQADAVGTDPKAAAERLGKFMDLDGLRARPQGRNVVFEVDS